MSAVPLTVNFEIRRNDAVGRYAVAACDLEPGDKILSEIPYAYGPKTDSPPVCLGCYATIDCSILCSACDWPVCSSNCETAPAHKEGECGIFSSAKVKFVPVRDTSTPCLQYECITPLRVLLAMERDGKKWKDEIDCMQSHAEERKTQEVWRFNQVNIVNYLRGPCRLQRFGEDLIHKVCGVLDVNTFEARTVSGNLIRCLYPKASIFSHNCVTNIAHSIHTDGYGPDGDFRIVVRAAVPVRKGSELFARYAYSTWPTMMRRQFLKQSKYFDCNCSRCSDPSELGTRMSTLMCSECKTGQIESIAPLDEDSNWKCNQCCNTLQSTKVKRLFRNIQTEIDEVESMDEDPSAIEAMEELFAKYKAVLHPRNAFCTTLKISLAQLYGKVYRRNFDQLSNAIYERKIQLCQDVLENIDIIEPGHSRLRGIVLYEMHAPVFLLAKNLYSIGVINEDVLRKRIQETIELLRVSSQILLLEPENSNEGMLGQYAMRTFRRLTENLEDIIYNITQS